MQLKSLIVAAGLFVNVSAFAAVQNDVCKAVTDQHYGFATQVACIVTIHSAQSFDQSAAGVCLKIANADQGQAGGDVIPCLQAISGKTYGAADVDACAALPRFPDVISCLNEKGQAAQ